MADRSAIEWTEVTWNPVTGCDRVSPGCAHCYALTLAKRLKAMGNPRYQRDGDRRASGPGFGVTLHADKLEEPLSWRRPRLVFVNSMSDLFHEEVPSEFIGRVLEVMRLAQRHTFQILTKRPERMRDWTDACARMRGWPVDEVWPPNVWLGTSIENRRFVHRADLLRETPAAVRFISAEPLLGPIADELDLAGIGWLIVGGESGPRHRPIRPEWVRDLRDKCLAEGVAFFHKQWGGQTPKAGGRELDGRTWDELPAQAGGEQLQAIAG